MAKVVSTKFGDRNLVHLPPVNFTGKETPVVHTLAPRGDMNGGLSPRSRYTGGYGTSSPQIVPKEYSYNQPDRRTRHDNHWLGPPKHAYAEGNIVQTRGEHRTDGLGNRIWGNLQQQHNVPTLQNYPQGLYPSVPQNQYPVIPPVGAGNSNFMQYTPHGLAPMNPQPVQQEQQPPPVQQAPPPPFPPPQPQQPQYNPYEKHIYYGPDGEVIPGPNEVGHPSPRHNLGIVRDFAIEGMLYRGRLVSIELMDNTGKVPKISDALTRDLIEKYGHIDKTAVRIVARRGQVYVHAVPQFEPPPLPPIENQYVPVYVDEYNQMIPPSELYGDTDRPYGTPYEIDRSYPYRNRGYSRYTKGRPATFDPISELRWSKDRKKTAPNIHPIERPYTRFTN